VSSVVDVDASVGDKIMDGDAEQRLPLRCGSSGKRICDLKQGQKCNDWCKPEERKEKGQEKPVVSIEHPFREYPATPEVDKLLASLIEQAVVAWVVFGKGREECAADLAAKRKKD
jgi:hypothetical protein